jgi:CDP-diacylglycerol--glycerol-3-phosphate 3-phosphatidyltransferase
MNPPHFYVPNLLSLSRIALGAAFFFLFPWACFPGALLCMLIVVIGGATDVLDGSLARRTKTVSLSGKWLDPLSDFTFFFFAYFSFYRSGLMPLVLFLLFLAREFCMYGVIRPLAMIYGLDPAARLPGKIKTICQNIGSLLVLFLMFLANAGLLPEGNLRAASALVLAVPVAVSLASLYWYIRPLAALRRSKGQQPDIPRVILLTVLSFLILQALLLVAVTALLHLPWQRLYLFLAVAVIYHDLFFLGLLLVKREFHLDTTGETLRGMNLPLILSFVRFSAVPAVLFLFLSLQEPRVQFVLIPFLALIFISDLLDGFLARQMKQTTRIGRILDASGDYLLITVLSIAYAVSGWIPLWLMILVLVRLIVQCLGIIPLYARQGYSALRLSFLGKASVFAVFCLYGFELLEFMRVPVLGDHTLVTVLEYGVAAVIAASLIEKLLFIRKDFRLLAARNNRS